MGQYLLYSVISLLDFAANCTLKSEKKTFVMSKNAKYMFYVLFSSNTIRKSVEKIKLFRTSEYGWLNSENACVFIFSIIS